MSVVHFETTRDGNLIRIPEQYMDQIPDRITVTLGDVEKFQKEPKKRQLGTLHDRGSVTFENDFYMTTEEFANL
jgi:hypothetical protein